MSKTPVKKKPAPNRKLLEQPLFKIGRRCREWFLPMEGDNATCLYRQGVAIAGQSWLRPPYIMARPYPPFHILLLPYSGELQLTLPGRIANIRAGEPWLMPAQSLYRYEILRGHVGMIWFHLDTTDVVPVALQANEPVKLPWPEQIISRMRFYFDTLREEEHSPDNASRELRRKIYELIAIELQQHFTANREEQLTGPMTRIRRLWELVDQNPGQGWDVPAMAVRAGLSPSRFHALCYEYFGLTPHEKLSRIRMNRAIAMLRLTDQKIEAIAQECGYSTQFAFSKAFKKTMGTSPKNYRGQ
jgi:AraC-like DNA-binding protein